MQRINRSGIVTISYTCPGAQLQAKLCMLFEELVPGTEVYPYGYRKRDEHTGDTCPFFIFEKTEDILDQHFDSAELFLFISAAGIAVRKLAPYLKSKTTDPAVLCMDETGRFVIPLLSGHLGGANAWAERIAQKMGATAVITTATDLQKVFAVDLFAKENGLLIEDSSRIREVSARLLAGEPVGICTDFEISGNIPDGLLYCKRDDTSIRIQMDMDGAGCDSTDNFGQCPECGITITEEGNRPQQFRVECRLLPRNLFLGIGCRKGTSVEAMEDFVRDTLKQNGLEIRRVCAVASIDIKKEEAAIRALAEKLGVPFQVYSADCLKACEGDFSASAFVAEKVGVDNVCERSAVCAAGVGAQMLLKKTAADGMTLSVAAAAVRIMYPL